MLRTSNSSESKKEAVILAAGPKSMTPNYMPCRKPQQLSSPPQSPTPQLSSALTTRLQLIHYISTKTTMNTHGAFSNALPNSDHLAGQSVWCGAPPTEASWEMNVPIHLQKWERPLQSNVNTPSPRKFGCRHRRELSSSSAGNRNYLSLTHHLPSQLTCTVLTGQIHLHFGGFSAIDHCLTHTRTKLPTRVHVDRTCIPPTTSYETEPFSRKNAHGCDSRLAATWNLSPSSRIRQTGWVCETSYELPDSATL